MRANPEHAQPHQSRQGDDDGGRWPTNGRPAPPFGGYVDEVRKINNFGARWYDQNRELFYSPDPILTEDSKVLVGTPGLRAAYSSAGSMIRYVDSSGQLFADAQEAQINADRKADAALLAKDPALRAYVEANLKMRLPKTLVRLGLDIEKAEQRQKLFESFDQTKPFVENISIGEVKVSPACSLTFGRGRSARPCAATTTVGVVRRGTSDVSLVSRSLLARRG